jgi:hypothetical protein
MRCGNEGDALGRRRQARALSASMLGHVLALLALWAGVLPRSPKLEAAPPPREVNLVAALLMAPYDARPGGSGPAQPGVAQASTATTGGVASKPARRRTPQPEPPPLLNPSQGTPPVLASVDMRLPLAQASLTHDVQESSLKEESTASSFGPPTSGPTHGWGTAARRQLDLPPDDN